MADSRGRPPTDQNFLNFMQFFGKIWQICMLVPPPEGVAPPPTRNPGYTPGGGTNPLRGRQRKILPNFSKN